jgi:hypothetical protein
MYHDVGGERNGGVGGRTAFFRIHKKFNHQIGNIICRHVPLPLFPSLIIYIFFGIHTVSKSCDRGVGRGMGATSMIGLKLVYKSLQTFFG